MAAGRTLVTDQGTETAILFGSRARGTAHADRDTDLVLAGGPANDEAELASRLRMLATSEPGTRSPTEPRHAPGRTRSTNKRRGNPFVGSDPGTRR